MKMFVFGGMNLLKKLMECIDGKVKGMGGKEKMIYFYRK